LFFARIYARIASQRVSRFDLRVDACKHYDTHSAAPNALPPSIPAVRKGNTEKPDEASFRAHITELPPVAPPEVSSGFLSQAQNALGISRSLLPNKKPPRPQGQDGSVQFAL
jgi:hypothetical protein